MEDLKLSIKFFDDEELREVIEDQIRRQIKDLIAMKYQKVIDSILDEEIAKEVKRIFGDPIIVNDGWNEPITYSSFENMFKKTLRKELDVHKVTYKAERIVGDLVKEKIKSHIEVLGEKLLEMSNTKGN